MSKENHHIHILTAEEIDDYMSKYDSESRYRRYKDWKKYLIIAISTIFCLFQLYSILSGRITAQVLSATLIFLFIFFGALLDKQVIGQFFIDICNAIAGGFDRCPDKVAVLTSAMFGTVSRSSVSNDEISRLSFRVCGRSRDFGFYRKTDYASYFHER